MAFRRSEPSACMDGAEWTREGRNGEGGGDASVTDGESGGRRGDEAAQMTMDRDRAKEEGEENRAHIKYPPHTHLYQGIASPSTNTLICTRALPAPVSVPSFVPGLI